MKVSRSPISCSSASSDRLYSAPRTIALNISTASHGLRPAADLRFSSAFRQTASSTGRKSSHGTSSPIIARCLPRFFSSFRRLPSAATSAKLSCLPSRALCHLSSPGLPMSFQAVRMPLCNIASKADVVNPSPGFSQHARNAIFRGALKLHRQGRLHKVRRGHRIIVLVKELLRVLPPLQSCISYSAPWFVGLLVLIPSPRVNQDAKSGGGLRKSIPNLFLLHVFNIRMHDVVEVRVHGVARVESYLKHIGQCFDIEKRRA